MIALPHAFEGQSIVFSDDRLECVEALSGRDLALFAVVDATL